MKIIGTDNLNRETVRDVLFIDSIFVHEMHLAQRICDKLNEKLGNHEGTFYKIVDDGYVLSRGMEDMV
jgi:hypothetical protein